MNPDGTGTSFRLRSTWAQLVSITVLYGGALIGISIDPTNPLVTAGFLTAATILLVIALVVLHIPMALLTRHDPDDERDAAIQLRSTRYSSYILSGGVVTAIIAIVAQQVVTQHTVGEPANPSALILNPLLIGDFLVLALVASELVRLATQLVDYHRGA